MDKEIIQVNPALNLDKALEDSRNKNKKMVVIDKSNEARNMLDANFETIRSYLHSRNDKLTVVFQLNARDNVWEVGIALPWGDLVLGLPPTQKKLLIKFASAIFDEWVKAQQMREKQYRLRHVLQGGKISGS